MWLGKVPSELRDPFHSIQAAVASPLRSIGERALHPMDRAWIDGQRRDRPPSRPSISLVCGPDLSDRARARAGAGEAGWGGGVESAALCCWKSQTDRPRPFSHSFLILPALDRCRAQNLRWQRSDGEQGLAGDMVPGHPSLAIHLFKVWTYLWFIRARYPETPLPASVFSRTP